MAKKEILLKSDEALARADVAAFFRQVSEALAKGQVVLKQDETLVELTVPDQVRFEVDVEEKPKKKGKQISLEFELEWLVREDGEPAGSVSIE
ncbi:MAG TPA: amphi-Trp domain-containing protein [Anaerolineales bacterium]|nr:amphi-Trp domain-containing protein [Anaerolineales bacterium]